MVFDTMTVFWLYLGLLAIFVWIVTYEFDKWDDDDDEF